MGNRAVGHRIGQAWIVVLVIVASAAAFAGCGSAASPAPSTPAATVVPAATSTPVGTVIPMPSELTEEQRRAVVTIPDPADATKPLAHLVGTRDLTADELAQAFRDDASFAALESDAVKRGFGKAVAAADLTYDNGVTVTIAELGSTRDALRFAFRSSPPKPHYLLVEIDRDGKRITAHDQNGTVSLDLATGETTFAESPTAHHSCSFLHCFHTALLICMDIPIYGEVVGAMCSGCIELMLSGVGAPLGAPVCLTCLATAVATLGASAWVCDDDPCGFCSSDSCGTAEPASEDSCTWWVGPADPVTGNASWISRVNYGYACHGIETGSWPFLDPSYENTQCERWSASGGLVTACPYGCAPAPSGDTRSRACLPPPSTCNPLTCTGETAVGVQACAVRPDDGKSVVTREYEVEGCAAAANGQTCGTTTETRVLEVCAGECSSDGRTCEAPQCDPATCSREVAEGDQVCRLGHVTQPTRRYACNATRTACESAVYDKPIQLCTAGCATDGTHCAGPGGGRTDTYTLAGNVYAAVSPDAYAVCPACTFRLSDTGGTFTVTSAANGSFSVSDVPSGSYRVERQCNGSTWVAGNAPWDVSLGYAAVSVPTTGAVDVLLPKCPSQK